MNSVIAVLSGMEDGAFLLHLLLAIHCSCGAKATLRPPMVQACDRLERLPSQTWQVQDMAKSHYITI